MRCHDIVVIGASAGGVSALQRLFSQFPPNLRASFFVVLHIPSESPSMLATLLDRAGPLTAKNPEDNEPIRLGHVYVAPPDLHMLVEPGYVRLYRSPKENRHRPAIDPLFRSAAVAYRARTVGIVLTGYLDDGTSGLLAIKRCGGLAIVQDPDDADCPDMPTNALAEVEVDYRLPIDKMGDTIRHIVEQPAADIETVPADIKKEVNIAGQPMSAISGEERLDQLGHRAAMSCPECNGPLWQIDADKMTRYRCHVGHGFTAKALMASQDAALEKALWVAMRTMEERASMALFMAKKEEERGRSQSAQVYEEQSQTSKAHAQMIHKLLLQGERVEKNRGKV